MSMWARVSRSQWSHACFPPALLPHCLSSIALLTPTKQRPILCRHSCCTWHRDRGLPSSIYIIHLSLPRTKPFRSWLMEVMQCRDEARRHLFDKSLLCWVQDLPQQAPWHLPRVWSPVLSFPYQENNCRCTSVRQRASQQGTCSHMGSEVCCIEVLREQTIYVRDSRQPVGSSIGSSVKETAYPCGRKYWCADTPLQNAKYSACE